MVVLCSHLRTRFRTVSGIFHHDGLRESYVSRHGAYGDERSHSLCWRRRGSVSGRDRIRNGSPDTKPSTVANSPVSRRPARIVLGHLFQPERYSAEASRIVIIQQHTRRHPASLLHEVDLTSKCFPHKSCARGSVDTALPLKRHFS